jgi:quercetin dioxygenase-like cupin family protein
MQTSLDPPLDTEIGELATGCQATDGELLVPAVLEAIAAGLAEVSPPWDLRPGEADDERHYERILATPSYEAWSIYWPPGTMLDLHDHGDSAGAFAVVDGALDETSISEVGPLERRLRRGDVASFGAGQVHGVANGSARAATSVHVYSPPISSMNYYVRLADGSFISFRRDDGEWDRRR